VTRTGRVTLRERCATNIPALKKSVERVPRPRQVIIEEGPLADWILRGLSVLGETVIVCNPRRNALIAKAGNKDDALDAEKLAQLARGGYIKEVHHPESAARMRFKRLVASYHDRVRNRVRQANRLMAEFRQYGVFVHEGAFVEIAKRPALVRKLPNARLTRDTLEVYLTGYDAAVLQEELLRRKLLQNARKEKPIRRFVALPGVGWIRAATFYAFVDEPSRFRKKSSLWMYIGIGLEHHQSGGPHQAESVRMTRGGNRMLKDMIIGAAMSAVVSRQDPTFADIYGRLLDQGVSPRNARHSAARAMATVLWSIWKTGATYCPERVGTAAASLEVTLSD
ncbi:MAG: transposase, partial [bacterium]|nr:transposase [bacterium]